LDAFNGHSYWQANLKAHVWGSTLVADGKVFIGDEDGDFTIFAAAREMHILHQVNLGEPRFPKPECSAISLMLPRRLPSAASR
jgi:hypothetical protein